MSKKTGQLLTIWGKDEKALSAEQQERKLKKMRRQAESHLAEMASVKETREDRYSALLEASKTQDITFSELIDAKNAVEASKVMYDEALALYEELFGETPALV
jgi:hypothetical protein